MKDKIFSGKQWGGIIILLIVLGTVATAKGHRTTTVLPGIWCSQAVASALSHTQQEALQTRLRRITGWTQLVFAENGKLEISDPTAVKGGAFSARRALLQAMRSGKQFVIENHSSSAAVHFGQLDEGTDYADDRSGVQLEIYRVRLDFADFDNLEAAPAVRESFDEGFTFFHELLHGLGLKDTPIPNEIGECEMVVNRMRTELGLPVRDQYLGELLRPASIVNLVRLRFKEPTLDRHGKPSWKKRYLFFVSKFAAEPRPSARSAACLSLY